MELEKGHVLDRASWGARPPRRPAQPLQARLIVVHHTTGPNDYAPGDVGALLRSIQDLHMDANGWDDIGYNLVVDRFGRVFEARRGVGAHTRGHNHRALGIALLGDFTDNSPAPLALGALERLTGGLPLAGHRDLAATECPGRAFVHLRRTGA